MVYYKNRLTAELGPGVGVLVFGLHQSNGHALINAAGLVT